MLCSKWVVFIFFVLPTLFLTLFSGFLSLYFLLILLDCYFSIISYTHIPLLPNTLDSVVRQGSALKATLWFINGEVWRYLGFQFHWRWFPEFWTSNFRSYQYTVLILELKAQQPVRKPRSDDTNSRCVSVPMLMYLNVGHLQVLCLQEAQLFFIICHLVIQISWIADCIWLAILQHFLHRNCEILLHFTVVFICTELERHHNTTSHCKFRWQVVLQIKRHDESRYSVSLVWPLNVS